MTNYPINIDAPSITVTPEDTKLVELEFTTYVPLTLTLQLPLIVSFLLPLIVLYFHLNERANLIDDFNKNKELICNMSSLKIDVSKADNWSVDKNSFLKGSTSIPVTKCEIKD